MKHYKCLPHQQLADLFNLDNGTWIYIHYLSDKKFFISKVNNNIATEHYLEPQFIELGYELLEYCQCKIGIVVFYEQEDIRFAGLSPELNLNFCWQKNDIIFQELLNLLMLQKITQQFQIELGTNNINTQMNIPKNLRPKLEGGWIQ